MKYRIIHFHRKLEAQIPGVYAEGEYDGRPIHFIDIPDEHFANIMRDFASKYDVMVQDGSNDHPFVIRLDDRGRMFRQR